MGELYIGRLGIDQEWKTKDELYNKGSDEVHAYRFEDPCDKVERMERQLTLFDKIVKGSGCLMAAPTWLRRKDRVGIHIKYTDFSLFQIWGFVVHLIFTNRGHMDITTLEEFYRQVSTGSEAEKGFLLPDGISREIGHFNVFNVKDLFARIREKPVMPYNRRAYYKISLISGRNRAEYADKVIDIEKNALLFATPKVPYHWLPRDLDQSGYFCIFTDEFLLQAKSGVVLDDLPIFKAGGYPVFQVTEENTVEIGAIFAKMHKEMSSDYAYKYDLIRNYLLELIHYGQKLQPATALYPSHTASTRVSSLFIELLERQFPIESPHQKLNLRTAADYADRLSVHVNHLNKVLKENTGQTTTDLIAGRIIKEAKILLKQTNWNISEIAYCLGFEEVAHFSNFFRKRTRFSPLAFRN
jgi:AraC-like DNA-binding protein